MKTGFVFLAFLAVLFVSPVQAQDTTSPASTHKSVRDMTPEERKLMWEQLPQEQKEKILARRAEMAKKASEQNKWKNLSGAKPAGTAVTKPKPQTGQGATGQWANDSSLSDAQKASIQRGADMWNAMTPEQKKAFIAKHQAQIQARQQGAQ